MRFQGIKRSLFLRLLLIFVGAGFLVTMVMSGLFHQVLSERLHDVVQPHMEFYVKSLIEDMGYPPDPEKALAITRQVPVDIRIEGPDIEWASTEGLTEGKELTFIDYPNRPGVRVARDKELAYLQIQNRGYTLWFIHPVIRDKEWHRDMSLLILATTLIALIICYWLVQRLLKPIRWIRTGTARFAAGELDHTIDTHGRTDELGELVENINSMGEEIRKMLEAKRHMLLAISHELRSPVTRIRLALEFLEPGKATDQIRSDLQEMETMITELLESERLKSKHSALSPESVNLGELVRQIIEDGFADSSTKIKLQLQEYLPTITLDPVRFRLMLKNTLENALRHSAGSVEPVLIAVEEQENTVRITITDKGEGVPPEKLPYLTEPFYRADDSRDRSTGGYGLGLYLCRVIAEAHNGEFEIASNYGVGTTVKITLPTR